MNFTNPLPPPEMGKTPWFDGAETPTRPGVYQRFYLASNTIRYNLWTGSAWCLNRDNPDAAAKVEPHSAAWTVQSLPWRGLSENPQ